MGGRVAGGGFGPVLFGIYLLYSNFSESTLFVQGPQASLHSALSALGGVLLLIGGIFLYKNLR